MPRSPSGASARRSPRVLIKSLERNALHTSRIRDMVRLNGNRSRGCDDFGRSEIGIAFVSSAASGNAEPHDGELSGRVARLEDEIAVLKQLIKRLQKDNANTAVA